MCGRFAQVIKYDRLKKLIDELQIANRDVQIEINYNVAPTQAVAAVMPKAEGNILSFFRWGLIPSWSAEVPKFQMINIRSETILEKPTFKTGLIRRRCLIPITGFYEWRKLDKQAFFIHGAQQDIIYLAGIYDTWTGADGSYVPSMGIITTEANAKMRQLHDRMPVIIGSDDLPTWMSRSYMDQKGLFSILKACPDDFIDYYPVSSAVNKVSEKGEICMAPVNVPA